MVVPLQLLAFGSLAAGLLGIPPVIGHWIGAPNRIEQFLEPAFAPARGALAEVFAAPAEGHGLELGVMRREPAARGRGDRRRVALLPPEAPRARTGWRRRFPAPTALSLHKYWVDEVYDGRLRARAGARGRPGAPRERPLRDRRRRRRGAAGLGVNGVAWGVRDLVARASDLWDRYVVDGAVWLTAFALDSLSYAFRAAQTGVVQHYALGLMIGLFLLIAAGRFVLGLY